MIIHDNNTYTHSKYGQYASRKQVASGFFAGVWCHGKRNQMKNRPGKIHRSCCQHLVVESTWFPLSTWLQAVEAISISRHGETN